jgi:hypothetical protein
MSQPVLAKLMESMEAEKPTLGYWNNRGLAGHIRMMLMHFGVPFENKTYPSGVNPDFAER